MLPFTIHRNVPQRFNPPVPPHTQGQPCEEHQQHSHFCGIGRPGRLWNPSTKYHGSLNVNIEHHPTIRYMVYNGYYKVMSNIPKMGQLPTPEYSHPNIKHLPNGPYVEIP